jgi:hypothetical protein
VEVVVDLNGRGPAAGADALNLFEREEAVGRNAIGADAELFAEALVDFVGAAQHATDVGADLNVVFAGGLEAEHGVVGGDVAHFKLGDADAAGNLGDDRVGEIANFVLRVEQHGNERGTLHGILLDERVEARGQRGREDGGRFGFGFSGSSFIASTPVPIASRPGPWLSSYVSLRNFRPRSAPWFPCFHFLASR